MPDFWTLEDVPVLIPASSEQPKKITNRGASNVGRNTTSAVVKTDNALTTGQSYFAEDAFWYVSAGVSGILVEDYADASSKSPNVYIHAGPPVSGTSFGSPVGVVDAGGILLDSTNGNLYVNEGTQTSPYWTPLSMEQPGLFSAYVQNSVGLGVPLANTNAEEYVAKGVRVFGQGLEVNDDSGFVGGTGVEGAEFNVMHVTNEASHLTALGTQAGIYQPDTHGTLAVDVTWADVADIATSSVFLGFIGTAASALDPVVTGATTTATFQIDDLAGWYSDSSMTDVNGGFLVSEKSDTSGTQTGLTTVVDRAAAGTYQRLRVEVTTAGQAIVFANRAEVGVIPGATDTNTHAAGENALDVDEEVSPVFYVENSTTTTRTANVKQFSTWGVLA